MTMPPVRAGTALAMRRGPRLAIVVVAAVLVLGCTATDDGTRVRDLDGAGEPLDAVAT